MWREHEDRETMAQQHRTEVKDHPHYSGLQFFACNFSLEQSTILLCLH